jgi:hypothetical protein
LTGRTEAQVAAIETIMKALRAVPWQDRESVFLAIRFNKEFCVNCGIDLDGYRCQCTNDA